MMTPLFVTVATQECFCLLIEDHKSTERDQVHRLLVMKIASLSFVAVVLASLVDGYSVPTTDSAAALARRQALGAIFGGSVAFVGASAANALDMDAFANAQIESDKKNCNPKVDPKCAPQLTKDQALCQYGQSGDARGEACKRVKAAGGSLPSAKPAGKSLGGAYAM